MKKLDEADFLALRVPFESGRQSPKHLGSILFLSIFLNVLLFALIQFVLGWEETIPYQQTIFKVHLIMTIVVSILSIIYSFPSVYLRSQKLQYLLSIIVTQTLFTFNFFLATIFILGNKNGFAVNETTLNTNIKIMLISGILVLIVTSIRFYYLLVKGEYRLGSNKDLLRRKIEAKQLFVPAVIVGTSLTLIIRSVNMTFANFDANNFVMILTGPFVYYACIFVLPEQLVLLYCKFRFKSFNYDSEGNLISTDVVGGKEDEF